MKATVYGFPDSGSDGNLMMEFTTMERFWRDSTQSNSYDPYTCAVAEMPFLECLDIAGARTLGTESAFDGVQDFDSVTNDDKGNSQAVLNMSVGLNASAVMLFGADVQCNGKTTGDGVTNAYDLAAIMWYQFRFPPYDTLGRVASTVSTVQGRDDTRFRCGNNETRMAWQLDVADDYCVVDATAAPSLPPTGTMSTVAGLFPGGRRLTGIGRRLTGAPPLPTPAPEVGVEVGTAEDRRLSESSRWRMNNMSMEIVEWAKVFGQGKWLRLRAPGVQVVMELYLAGVATEVPVKLSMASTPVYNCTQCLPDQKQGGATALVIQFKRRLEYSGQQKLASQRCATIVPAAMQTAVMVGNTIALRQQPPSKACAFDIFLWVPEAPGTGAYVAQSNASAQALVRLAALGADPGTPQTSCFGTVGVLPGSTASDLGNGRVQRVVACERTDSFSPSPPPPPVSPSPPPPVIPGMLTPCNPVSNPGQPGDRCFVRISADQPCTNPEDIGRMCFTVDRYFHFAFIAGALCLPLFSRPTFLHSGSQRHLPRLPPQPASYGSFHFPCISQASASITSTTSFRPAALTSPQRQTQW